MLEYIGHIERAQGIALGYSANSMKINEIFTRNLNQFKKAVFREIHKSVIRE
jgi:hypothetical protein